MIAKCTFSAVFILSLVAARGAEGPLLDVHTAMTVKVASFVDAQSRLQQWATDNGLRISSTALASTQKGRKHGWVQFEVPSDKLDQAIAQVTSLGKVVESRKWSDNLGWQKTEASARLVRVKNHEARLEALLQGRKLRVQDKMYLYDRLFQNGADQDDLSRDLVEIDTKSQRASVNVTLFEPYLRTENAPNVSGPRKTLEGLRSQLANITADAVSWFVQTLMKLLIYSPLWIPGVILGRRWIKQLRSRSAAA